MSAVTADKPSAATGQSRTGLLITISATYGSGGSVIAPALAQRLGVPFLQRVTGPAGALGDQAVERLLAEEKKTIPVGDLIACLTHAMPAGPTLSPPSIRGQHEQLRRRAEAEITSFAAGGRGVILGRAAAIVLGKHHGYHVRLDGPSERRIVQGAAIEKVGLDKSRAHMGAADHARTAYVRRLYRVDPADGSLYHLVLDSTAVPLETAIELILTAAASAQPAAPEPQPPGLEVDRAPAA